MATRQLLFSRFEVKIDGNRLHARAWGEPVDVARHQPAAEAKGVSFCQLKVVQQADGQWLAQAVVDVCVVVRMALPTRKVCSRRVRHAYRKSVSGR